MVERRERFSKIKERIAQKLRCLTIILRFEVTTPYVLSQIV